MASNDQFACGRYSHRAIAVCTGTQRRAWLRTAIGAWHRLLPHRQNSALEAAGQRQDLCTAVDQRILFGGREMIEKGAGPVAAVWSENALERARLRRLLAANCCASLAFDSASGMLKLLASGRPPALIVIG